jgi:hypothetical protein
MNCFEQIKVNGSHYKTLWLKAFEMCLWRNILNIRWIDNSKNVSFMRPCSKEAGEERCLVLKIKERNHGLDKHQESQKEKEELKENDQEGEK